MKQHLFVGIAAAITLAGCGADEAKPVEQSAPVEPMAAKVAEVGCANGHADGVALFGDVHVHTSYSFDAAANSFGATPVDAHNYAKGQPIPFFPLDEAGRPMGTAQIDRPLDFLAVTDHGEFLGERRLCRSEGSPVYDTAFCQNYRSDQRTGMMMLGTVITTTEPERIPDICGEDGALCRDFAKTPWESIQEAANEANEPCEFTSFIAYEYTGTPNTSNYHRNVIFRNEHVPALPVSYIDAPIDSKLWAGLDAVCLEAEGCEYLTIPHNTNLANGRMAPYMGLDDTIEAKRAYAATRLRREPIMEIFQHKGASECVNGLSTVFGAPDELCDQEAVRVMGEDRVIPTRQLVDGELVVGSTTITTTACAPGEVGANGMVGAGCIDASDFHRSALLIGLREEAQTGLNPVKLGVVAATDTHSANPGGVDEANWDGAVTGESTPAERLQPGLLTSGIDGNPGGLAGVWAKENTRDAIFDAMLRREVFGTSGPRIKIRLFAGWDFDPGLCDDPNRVSVGYASGVPMGADVPAGSGKMTLLAMAMQDPQSQKLNALQIIKGWVEGDELHNEVIDLVQSDAGESALCSVYVDDEFDSTRSAYYYVRAVEPETPRWHTYDCARLEPEARPDVCTNGAYPDTVREMAWSSPVWYRGVP